MNQFEDASIVWVVEQLGRQHIVDAPTVQHSKDVL
jgi:hypothetical protein